MAIGGPGDVEPGVSAGLAAQPLVAPLDSSVVGPQAVSQLVDAFRQGAITSQDIVDHIGSVAQAKKRALLEELGEYVRPEAIQSRMAQVGAQGAQANLATAQAQAGQELLPSQTLAAKNQTLLSQYNPADQEAINAFGAFNQTPRKSDGTYDYDSIVSHGYDYKGAFNMLQVAQKGMQVGNIISGVDAKGQPTKTILDGFGQPRTPESVAKYSKMYQQAFDEAYRIRQTKDEDGPVSSTTPTEANPRPVIEPATSPAPAAATPAVAPAAAPTAAGAAPTVSPLNDVQQATIPGGPIPGYTPKDIDDRLMQSPGYKEWAATASDVNTFRQLSTLPDEQANSLFGTRAEADRALAISVLGMLMGGSSGGAPRQVSTVWDDMVEKQPLPAKVKESWRLLLGKEALTSDLRKDLVTVGNLAAREKESRGWGALQSAVVKAKQSGMGPSDILTDPNDLNLWMRGVPSAAQAAVREGDMQPGKPAVNPTAKGQTVTFKTGPYANRPMVANGDGSYSPAQ